MEAGGVAVLRRVVLLLSTLLMIGGLPQRAGAVGPIPRAGGGCGNGMPISGAHVMVTWIREPPSLHVSQWFYDAT